MLWIRILLGLYGCLMTIVMTCLFTRGFRDIYTNFLDHLYSFDYLRTYVEIYFLILFNSILFLIQSIQFCSLTKSRRRILMAYEVFLYAYALSKFLIVYEWIYIKNASQSYQFDRFDYLILIFTPIFAIISVFLWQISFHSPVETRVDERTPLLQVENAEVTVQIKQANGSWWRILKLGTEEWKLYIFGFVCLLLAAFSKKKRTMKSFE